MEVSVASRGDWVRAPLLLLDRKEDWAKEVAAPIPMGFVANLAGDEVARRPDEMLQLLAAKPDGNLPVPDRVGGGFRTRPVQVGAELGYERSHRRGEALPVVLQRHPRRRLRIDPRL